MKHDLLITAARDRRWADLDCFAISVALSGFQGRKVMLWQDVPSDARERLFELGWELYEVRQESNLHFQSWRYYPAHEFIKSQSDVRHVMWTDACDVVFQADPSVWLEFGMGPGLIVAAKEAWRIKHQGINDYWVRRLVTDQEYQRIREHEVLCSGTIFGQHAAMVHLFDQMLGRMGDETQGVDQGIFNVLVHETPVGRITRIPDVHEGFIATCGTFLAPSDQATWTYQSPLFDRSTGLVMTPDGSIPFSVVHQYNRKFGSADPTGDWRGVLEQRYRSRA